MLVLEDHPLAELLLLGEHVAEEASALFGVVFARRFELELELLGHEGVAVDLAVRMGHRDAHRLTAVFKDEDVFDLFVLRELFKPLAPQVDQLRHMVVRQFGDRRRVPGRIEDDLAFAVGGRGFEEVVRHVVRLGGRLAQRREVVVVFEHVVVVRHLARARAEGAPVLGHLRARLPMGSDHDPVLCQGMPS